MTGNPESDTLWSGSHIQKRLHDPSCSSWEERGEGRTGRRKGIRDASAERNWRRSLSHLTDV